MMLIEKFRQRLLANSPRRLLFSVALVYAASALCYVSPRLRSAPRLFVAVAVSLFTVSLIFEKRLRIFEENVWRLELGPFLTGLGLHLRAWLLTQQENRLRRAALRSHLAFLRDFQKELHKRFGPELGNALRRKMVLVVDDRNVLGSLVFAAAMEGIGFHVTVVNSFGGLIDRDELASAGAHQMPDLFILGGTEHEQWGPFPRTIQVPLTALAADNIHAWDAVLASLRSLPPGAELFLRDYFRHATALVRRPPDQMQPATRVPQTR